MIKTHKLFIMPACDKCTAVKQYLEEKQIQFEDHNLAGEGMEEFRRYYPKVKEKVTRNEDGSLVIPIMLFLDSEENIVNFANKIEEIKHIIENVSLQDIR